MDEKTENIGKLLPFSRPEKHRPKAKFYTFEILRKEIKEKIPLKIKAAENIIIFTGEQDEDKRGSKLDIGSIHIEKGTEFDVMFVREDTIGIQEKEGKITFYLAKGCFPPNGLLLEKVE